MRFAVLGTAAFMTVAACGGRTTAPAAAPAPAMDAEASARHARANQLRDRILAATRWEEPEKNTPCDPGALRTSGSDSTSSSAQVDSLVRALEREIIVSGIDEPIDTPAGHALLRLVLSWEAGEARPRWDVPAGVQPKRAVSAGLTGEYYNMETKQCLPLAPQDTFTMIVPAVANFTAPKVKTATVLLFQGDSGVTKAREDFYARHGARDTAAVFMYTRVRAMVLWRDYAVVAVNRPLEKQGVFELQKGAGGATYIFRRSGEEWRLLVIARTWT